MFIQKWYERAKIIIRDNRKSALMFFLGAVLSGFLGKYGEDIKKYTESLFGIKEDPQPVLVVNDSYELIKRFEYLTLDSIGVLQVSRNGLLLKNGPLCRVSEFNPKIMSADAVQPCENILIRMAKYPWETVSGNYVSYHAIEMDHVLVSVLENDKAVKNLGLDINIQPLLDGLRMEFSTTDLIFGDIVDFSIRRKGQDLEKEYRCRFVEIGESRIVSRSENGCRGKYKLTSISMAAQKNMNEDTLTDIIRVSYGDHAEVNILTPMTSIRRK